MTNKNQAIGIHLFYCSNSLQQEELNFLGTKIKDVKLTYVSLPCSGKVNLLYLLKVVEMGSDGILLVTCKPGKCKYLQGNFRAHKRIESVDNLLVEIGFEKSHVKHISLEEENKTELLLAAINELAKTLKVELQHV